MLKSVLFVYDESVVGVLLKLHFYHNNCNVDRADIVRGCLCIKEYFLQIHLGAVVGK